MSASPASSPVNGHASPTPDSPGANGAAAHQSESDLSDVEPTYANAASRSPSASPDEDEDDVEEGGEEEEVEEDEDLPVANDFEDEPSEPSDNDVSDDADFNDAQSDADADADPDVDAVVDQDEESSASSDSGRAPKRKASAMADDDYMRSNPELYGLRRSVRLSFLPFLPYLYRRPSLTHHQTVPASSAAKDCRFYALLVSFSFFLFTLVDTDTAPAGV